jgi:hypothetical protein
MVHVTSFELILSYIELTSELLILHKIIKNLTFKITIKNYYIKL